MAMDDGSGTAVGTTVVLIVRVTLSPVPSVTASDWVKERVPSVCEH